MPLDFMDQEFDAGFETRKSAVARYKREHSGIRDIVTWGPNDQPVEIQVEQSDGDTRTFLNLGGADRIPVQGNDDDDVATAVQRLAEVTPMISSRF